MMRLSLVLLGACWSAPDPEPPVAPTEPPRQPIEDWSRALANTHIVQSTAYREQTVSFTVNVPFEPDRTRDVTIVPLHPELVARPGRITEIEQRLDPIDERSFLWQTDIESRDARYLAVQPRSGQSAEYPFDAVLIVPARKTARLVTTPERLPADVAREDVSAAIDLDNDGKADVIVWEQEIKEDYSQGGTYARTPSGWKQIHSWMPL